MCLYATEHGCYIGGIFSWWINVCKWSALPTLILHVPHALATGMLVTHVHTVLLRIAGRKMKYLGNISMCIVYNTAYTSSDWSS